MEVLIMAFNIKKRGKLTYYYRGENPVFSALVTEELPDGCHAAHDRQLPDSRRVQLRVAASKDLKGEELLS